MVVFIDNFDSFTYNLVHLFGQIDNDIRVYRNNAVSVSNVRELAPQLIVLSPGPGVPQDAGICIELIQELGGSVPILGVCLGHQAIAAAYGGRIARASVLMHGKTSRIYHDAEGLFHGLPNPFTAMRYHSLIVEEESLTDSLIISAHTSGGEIMGIRHKDHPTVGVQFHPESILSEHGARIAANMLASCLAGSTK